MGTGGDTVPVVVFDAATLPPEDRIAGWSRLAQGYDIRLPEGASPETFSVACRAWLLDDLVVTANRVDAVELHRTAAHIQAYPRDTYTLILLLDGQWWADLDHGSIQVGAGQVCVMDFTVPWDVYGTRQENVMIVVPRSVVHEAAPGAPRLHGRLLEGGGGRLLAEHMLLLTRHLSDLPQADARHFRDATVALLGSALRSGVGDPPRERRGAIRATSVGAIRAFIDANLTHADLDAARICDALPVTRATLYRAFSDAGGVRAYIQRRRLEAAHALLCDGEAARSMAEIAHRFHFSSPAHFSTAFRRQFGHAPRDVRATGGRPDATALFQSYVDILGPAATPAGSAA